MNDKATIDRIYKWADKNRIKYYNEYQQGGSPSALKTSEKYDDICDICRAAEREVSEEDELKKHIHKNQMYIIDQLKEVQKVSSSKAFTYEEVEKWVRKMMI